MNGKRQVRGNLVTWYKFPFVVYRKREANLSTEFWSLNSEAVSFFQLVTGDLVLLRKRFIGCEVYFLPRFY